MQCSVTWTNNVNFSLRLQSEMYKKKLQQIVAQIVIGAGAEVKRHTACRAQTQNDSTYTSSLCCSYRTPYTIDKIGLR